MSQWYSGVQHVPAVGSLRERVTLRTYTFTADALGGEVRTWADLATVWGRVEPLQGRERYAAQAVQPTLTYRVTIRHRTDVYPKMQVLWDGRTLEVDSVSNTDARDRFLVLDCVETT